MVTMMTIMILMLYYSGGVRCLGPSLSKISMSVTITIITIIIIIIIITIIKIITIITFL